MIVEQITQAEPGEAGVRGYLHRCDDGGDSRDGLVLTHGAGGNCNSPLLTSLAEALCGTGLTVLRCDLPFRQLRPKGPPLGTAKQDQAGLLRASECLRQHVSGRIFLGGHSYGGRMATMLAAENPFVADGLLLLSYPLHPPRKPEQMRTAHFPKLHTRSMFVQGTRDPFATIEEIETALKMIPEETRLITIDGAGHDLFSKKTRDAVERVANAFHEWATSK